MTALPARPLGTPGLALPAPEWPGTHDEARGSSVPPPGPALVTPASVREVVESHMPEDHDPETWRAFWGVKETQ